MITCTEKRPVCDIIKRPDASDTKAPPPELLPVGEWSAAAAAATPWRREEEEEEEEEPGGEGLGEGGVPSEKEARD